MKKLKLRIAKFDRILVVEQLERTGEWKNSEHVKVQSSLFLLEDNIDLQEDNYDENKNGANLLVTQMEEFLKEIVEKEGEDTVKAAIDLLNSDYYRLSIDGYDGRSGPTWKKLYNKLYQNNLNETANYFPY